MTAPPFEPAIAAQAEQQLKHFKRLSSLGDTSAVVLAVRWCNMAQLPLPDWLAADVEAATEFYFRNGGAAGRGKTGGNLARYRRQKIDRRRHQVALRELARRDVVGGTREEAFQRASDALDGTPARGSAKAIERSHDKIQRLFKSLRAGNPA